MCFEYKCWCQSALKKHQNRACSSTQSSSHPRGNTVILSVVDRCSKMDHYGPCPKSHRQRRLHRRSCSRSIGSMVSPLMWSLTPCSRWASGGSSAPRLDPRSACPPVSTPKPNNLTGIAITII